MIEFALLFAQTVATGSAAAWMLTGVRDNIKYPALNETYTAQVMEMQRIKEGFPEAYAPVAHRAVTNRRLQLLAFRCVVAGELIACIVLMLGALALGLALIGIVAPLTAKSIAIIGATLFTAVWAGMLVGGNHFNYWFGHEGAQLTHYHMNLWGLALIILLAV